jgi:hypothetical protein
MKLQTLTVLLAASLLVPACGVTVDKQEQNGKAKVDINTPFGSINVNTQVDPAATGLPIYPGARPAHDQRGEPGSADVNVGNSYFGVKVVAAKFEHDDAPEPIIDFYKSAMKTYGTVLECHGNIDFRHGDPVCKERRRKNEVQLVTGTEHRHRIVVVKPHGSGSEFSAVYIQTRGES